MLHYCYIIAIAILFCILYLAFEFTLNSYDVCFWESSPWTWDISFMIKWRLSGASAFSSLQILLQCTEGPRIRRVLGLEKPRNKDLSVLEPVILSILISCLMFWESKFKFRESNKSSSSTLYIERVGLAQNSQKWKLL